MVLLNVVKGEISRKKRKKANLTHKEVPLGRNLLVDWRSTNEDKELFFMA